MIHTLNQRVRRVAGGDKPLQHRFLQALKAPLNQDTTTLKEHKPSAMLSLYQAKTKCFSLSTPAECQIDYQTTKTNKTQQKQASHQHGKLFIDSLVALKRWRNTSLKSTEILRL